MERGNRESSIVSPARRPVKRAGIFIAAVGLAAFAMVAPAARREAAASGAAPQDSKGNAVLVSVTPPSAAAGAEIQVPISIDRNAAAVEAFGLDLSFPEAMLDYLGASKGNLTADWSRLEGNRIAPGRVRAGGFAGSGTKIAAARSGILVVLRFRVTCGSCPDGEAGRICLSGFVDGLAGMGGAGSCALFTFNK